MDPENILDLLLKALPLSSETIGFVRELYGILSACPSSSNSSYPNKKPTPRDIEDTAAKLREVIAFFGSADEDRDKFLDIFPEWKRHRTVNIKKLREIAESMKDSRQISSIVQIVGGGVGIIGGVAIIGSLLFPPAAPALLPAWLGGAAATALIPSFLLPAAATAATSTLAVGGTIAVGAGGVTQVVTSATEAAVLSVQIDKAKEICRQDKEIFDRLMSWFEHTQQLKSALDQLFAIDILEVIFADLKDYFGNCSFRSTAFRCALLKCFKKTLGRGLSNPYLHVAVTAVTFTVFLVQRRNRFLLQWIIVGFGLVAAFNAGPQLGRLIASTFVKDASLIPKALASKVAVGALAGVGVVLDVTNIILNSIDLAEGSESEVQKKVLEVAEELQKNLDFIQEVHQKLLDKDKKNSEDFLNSLMVDKLGMRGSVTVIAHEVYQDVLKESRKLRRSRSCRNFVQMDPSFNSLRKVIDFFNKAEEENEIFRIDFRQWENKREENVKYLYLIAESLQKVKTFRSEAPYVDVIEGAWGTIAWLLQRIQCFVNTAVLTCKIAIDNSNAATIVKQLRERTEETSRICRRDREDLIKVEGWFLRMHQLNFAFDDLFGAGMFDNIFVDLKKFCGDGIQKYRYSLSHQAAFKRCVSKIFSRPTQIDPSIREAVIAVFFALLLDQRGRLSYLSCLNVTRNSRFGGRRWTADFAIHLDREESLLQTLDVDSVEGGVVLLDTIKTFFKLAKTDETAFRELAAQLQGELGSMRIIWQQLRTIL